MEIAESVTAQHPDKVCDQISDAILDDCLKQDPMSRVAIEVMGGHGIVTITGELTTKAFCYMDRIAKKVYRDLGYQDEIGVQVNVVSQSPDIAQGVNTGGAGDQGIMIGYACNENEAKIPQELYLARQLLKPFKADAKSQVVLNDDRTVNNIVLSVQGKTQKELNGYLDGAGYKGVDRFCNNTGAFEIGGFSADSGVTGRKIVVDAYGPRVSVGGGAFSGKDPTKVDRSGAYMARWIALKELKKGYAYAIKVELGYVIGKSEPIMATIYYHDKDEYFTWGENLDLKEYDCRSEAIIERFNLRRPIYQQTANRGHFGYINEYPWEKI